MANRANVTSAKLSKNGVTEMVGRLNFTVVWRILWAGSRRIIDMQILVPKQYSTGGKAKLSGISKRGNR